MRLQFTIPGPPVPKARARVVGVAAKIWGMLCGRCKGLVSKAHASTPEKTSAYEAHVGVIAHAARLAFDQYRHTPAHRWPWQDKTARFGIVIKLYLSGREGDGDNYFKSIADSCNNVLWVDDRQIDDGRFVKVRCERGQERAEVEIWVL